MPHVVDIPDKAFFKIGEVARLLGVKPHVLRYWETEFPLLKPAKTPTGQRVYSRPQVALVAEIRHLLYERRFTIEGARKRLRRKADEATGLVVDREVVDHVGRELEELIRLVE